MFTDRFQDSSLVYLARSASGAAEASRLQLDLAARGDGSGKSPATALGEQLFREAGLDAARVGTSSWNPLGDIIREGDSVTIKPNWVHHHNSSGQGVDCLVTSAAVLEMVINFALRAKPRRIIVGDAPVQGCDFEKLMSAAQYGRLRNHYREKDLPVEWRDFRCVILDEANDSVSRVKSDQHLAGNYVLFDLGKESCLEPIAGDAGKFRVTMYNPDLLRRTHDHGKHQYLVAREVIESDVVINLPKLKTHKKACVTGALKNVVGINGHKAYLPHHRLGGSKTGGDCYAGGNRFKLVVESMLDQANRTDGTAAGRYRKLSRWVQILARLSGGDSNLEGSWFGNDTIWRTCLDLNRIFYYGRLDGALDSEPRRRVLTLTDALICGEGEGPLSPLPHYLGMMTLAANPVAAEYLHAHLMGFDWKQIPLIRQAFGGQNHPLCTFGPADIAVQFEGKRLGQPFPHWSERGFLPPQGWRGHCEQMPSGLAFSL